MNMRQMLIGLAILLFGVLSVLAQLSSLNSKEHLNEVLTQLNQQREQSLDLERSLSQQAAFHSLIGEHFSISHEDALVNEENESVKPGSIVADQKLLIFKISKTNCISCIESELPYLDAFFQQKGPQYTVSLWSDDYTARELKILKEKYQIKYPVFHVPAKIFTNLLVEKINQPYLFMLNKSLVATAIFVPDRRVPALSAEYYKQAHIILAK